MSMVLGQLSCSQSVVSSNRAVRRGSALQRLNGIDSAHAVDAACVGSFFTAAFELAARELQWIPRLFSPGTLASETM